MDSLDNLIKKHKAIGIVLSLDLEEHYACELRLLQHRIAVDIDEKVKKWIKY